MMITSFALLASLHAADVPQQTPQFAEPVQLEADGKSIQVEAPGYASPAFSDVDGDGHGDLVVGQFHEGKMKVYRGDGKGTFGKGQWLEADGEIAKVPGVW